MKLAKWFGAAAVAVAVLGLAACGASNKESGNGKDKTVTIKIGTMTIDNDEQQRWDLIQKKLEKENVKLDFTPFTEYRYGFVCRWSLDTRCISQLLWANLQFCIL